MFCIHFGLANDKLSEEYHVFELLYDLVTSTHVKELIGLNVLLNKSISDSFFGSEHQASEQVDCQCWILYAIKTANELKCKLCGLALVRLSKLKAQQIVQATKNELAVAFFRESMIGRKIELMRIWLLLGLFGARNRLYLAINDEFQQTNDGLGRLGLSLNYKRVLLAGFEIFLREFPKVVFKQIFQILEYLTDNKYSPFHVLAVLFNILLYQIELIRLCFYFISLDLKLHDPLGHCL
jgi:hypothetical protein